MATRGRGDFQCRMNSTEVILAGSWRGNVVRVPASRSRRESDFPSGSAQCNGVYRAHGERYTLKNLNGPMTIPHSKVVWKFVLTIPSATFAISVSLFVKKKSRKRKTKWGKEDRSRKNWRESKRRGETDEKEKREQKNRKKTREGRREKNTRKKRR